MEAALTLISHRLCPYVQRVAIVLAEKGVDFERRWVDLAAKPDWFLAVSPLGRTPVLLVGEQAVFESAAICEYLDDTRAPRLHPADALQRARHRAWMELGSMQLQRLAALYNAPTDEALAQQAAALHQGFALIDAELGAGPFFGGPAFSLVDAVFAPVFRYFDVLDRVEDFAQLRRLPRLRAWREALAARPSVRAAAPADYAERLQAFLRARPGVLAARV